MIFNESNLLDIDRVVFAFDEALSVVAREVGQEIQDAFVNAITMFYNSYGPNSYDRTFSMYSFSSGYSNAAGKRPLSKRNGKLDYTAGITVGPEHVKGNPYKKNHGLDVDPAWVFDVSYVKGIHGFNRMNILATRKEDEERIQEKYKKYTKNGISKINEDGRTEFRNGWVSRNRTNAFDIGYYKTALYDNRYRPKNYNVWEQKIPKTSVPPDSEVRRRYKAICKEVGKKMDVVISKIL